MSESLEMSIQAAWERLTESGGYWTCRVTTGGRVTLTPMRTDEELLGEVGTYTRAIPLEWFRGDVYFVYAAMSPARGR